MHRSPLILIFLSSFAPISFGDSGLNTPKNPYLADSPWAITHGNSYNQHSSSLPGPKQGPVKTQFLDFLSSGTVASISNLFSSPNAWGKRSIWSSSVKSVVKSTNTLLGPTYIDSVVASDGVPSSAFEGTYAMLDKDTTLFTARGDSIKTFRDEVPLFLTSGIKEGFSFTLPSHLKRDSEEKIAGMNMTFDGRVVFATNYGLVGVLSRNLDPLSLKSLRLSSSESISNSIATDDEGGIYAVTDKAMYRVQWNSTGLSIVWRAPYKTGPAIPPPGRVGVGSGSTPSLMGGKNDRDKFVVISDGDALMHVVLFWRDQIPTDWKPIGDGIDRRIAAETPIRYGDPQASESQSEQSVAISGYSALVVNNSYGDLFGVPTPAPVQELLNLFPLLQTAMPALLANCDSVAPKGMEKLTWNSTTRKLISTWANAKVSCSSVIPSISTGANAVYCMGAKQNQWSFESLDWTTGDSLISQPLGILPRYNGFFSATEIGPEGDVYVGGLTGLLRIY